MEVVEGGSVSVNVRSDAGGDGVVVADEQRHVLMYYWHGSLSFFATMILFG